jgi:type IV secretion system protein VirB4
MENSLSEVLPWLFAADEQASLIVNKDSSLLGAWRMRGVDVESAEEGALDRAAQQLDEALRRAAEERVTFWSLAHRDPVDRYPRGKFDNNVAQYIDDVWAEAMSGENLFENRHYMAVAMSTRGSALSLGELVREAMDGGAKLPKAVVKALRSRVNSSQAIGFKTRDELDLAMRRYESTVGTIFANALGDFGLDRLKGAELMGLLKSTVSGRPAAPVGVDHTEYLDAYLSDTRIDNAYSDYVVLEGVKREYVGVFTLKKTPPGGLLQTLNPVMGLPMKLRIAVAWKSYTAKEADSFLSSARTFDEMRSLSPRKLIRMAMAPDDAVGGDDTPTTRVGAAAEELRAANRARDGYFGAIAATVLIFADTPEQLEINMEVAARALERSRLVFIRERDGNFSGFCTSIPGHERHVVRWHFVEASNVTDTAPVVSLESGDDHHPFFSEGRPEPLPPCATFRSRYSTVQYFNYHTGQLGHTLFVGPSRNGKTLMQMFLESQFLKYPNARIFNLDKDLSCKPATLMLGGTHIDLDPARGGGLKLNPISMAKTEHGRAWLVGWLDRLFAARGEQLNDRDLEEVSKALQRLATLPGARLSTMLNQLPEHLRMRLMPWCEGGAFGQFFDHAEDEFSLERITTTEVGSLLSASLFDVVRAYAEYAFYRIERFLMDRDVADLGPTMIYFEEAGFLLEDPIFAAKARDYLMTLAKKRAFLVMTAQSPESFTAQPALASAVRDNIATIVFLPNQHASRPDLSQKYREVFGLNNLQIDTIASARGKQEYCVYQPQTNVFRVIDAQFPLEIVNCLRSDAASQAVLNRHYNPQDPTWKEKYLQALLSA